MEKVISYIRENENRYLEELFDLLRIPSVSSQQDRKDEVLRCAEWVKDHCLSMGLEAEVMPTQGHPIVLAQWMKKPGAPTLLIYGHYDVQPEDPVDLWDSPPFEPTVKGKKLFCRGSVDDKGQFFAHMKAIEALLKVRGELPINVKLLIEGEEEVGSESLETFLPDHKEQLTCDLITVADSPMYRKGIPTITLGLRGLVYFEINLTSCTTDLHSGSFGGAVPNAATAACQIVAKLKDEKGRILIPGIYDDVLPLSDAEKESLERLPFDPEAFMKEIGLKALVGEEGYSTLERLGSRPTCDVMGIEAGYTGEGAKTVIPAKAMVKVSLRLVADQKPDKVAEQFISYVKEITPEGVDADVTYLHGGQAYVANPNHPAFQAGAEAVEAGFGAKAAFNREGGSIPIVNVMTDLLGVPCLLMGLGLPDENAHAPNEYIDIDNFQGGIRSFAHFYDIFAKKS